jgi:hypothetical protein
LGELVWELSAVHGKAAERVPSLQEVFGPQLQTVLDRGLATVPPEKLRQLLRQPQLLLDLQELVLQEGGSFWEESRPLPEGVPDAVERGRHRLEAFLGAEEWLRESAPPVFSLRRARRLVRPTLLSLATVAATLLAVLLFQHYTAAPSVTPPVVATTWGWNKPAALPQNVPAKVYLATLADEAREWFDERPEDPVALARRLNEFRRGCSTLILAEHRPLKAEDRQWLVDKCRLWAQKLDRHLMALEAGLDYRDVRDEVDETITKLSDALRQRAEAV